MIKITLITLMSAGLLGTGAHTLGPQEVELAAGTLAVKAGAEGVTTEMQTDSEYAIRIRLKSGRYIAVRF